MINLKKVFILAVFAFVLAVLGLVLAQNAIDNAINNTSYEVVVNNTNLAPTIHPLVPGTGDRVDNTTYTASLYPIELHVFAHANNVSETAQVDLYIDDTLIQAQAGRPLGGAEIAYRGIDTVIPKNATYRVDFSNYHHYEWREYPILSGNGTISINNDHAKLNNLTLSTSGHTVDTTLNMNDNFITGIYGLESSGTDMLISSNFDMDGHKIKTLGEPTLSDDAVTKNYTDTGLNTKVNKSGDTMTGNLGIGKSPDYTLHLYNSAGNTYLAFEKPDDSFHNAMLWYKTGAFSVSNPAWQFGEQQLYDPDLVVWNWDGSSDVISMRFNQNGNIMIPKLAGTGNAYVCVDSSGTLYRNATICA